MLFDAPDALKWNKNRNTFLNVLGVIAYLVMSAVFICLFVLSAFVAAIFGLAVKSK